MPLAKTAAGLLAASSILAMAPAHAGIVSVTGAATQIAAPSSAIANTTLESYTQAFVFNELQNVTLSQAAAVNATTSGVFDQAADLTAGTIDIGTLVSSFYLHADPVGAGGVVYWFSGSISFDTDILGVAALNNELVATNFLGAPGTSYPSAATVNGLDFADNTDSFTISGDRRTLSFTLAAWAGSDVVRVITAANTVPEPGALSLAFAALGALMLTRRKRATPV